MAITASIVTYKTSRDELEKCIDSLRVNEINTIFISDNSPSNELKFFCEHFQQVVYIYNNGNIGYGAGHNVAIRKAKEMNADYHLVINSDVYFAQDIIAKIMTYMEENIDVAQLIPNVVYPNGELQYVCRMLPTPANLVFRRFLPKRIVEKMNNKYLLEFDDHKRAINIAYHQGSFMFFRVKCFEKVGLFDERFFMYPEDIDITRRMYKYYRTMFWPEVTIVHAHRGASYNNKKMLMIHMVNMIRYFNKWGWFFDKERKLCNNQLLKELNYRTLKNKRQI
jgi:GT2 family glycosyltransferase